MNKGMIRLLKKYGDIVESIHREYNDGVDYWVYLKNGFICPIMECATIHEYSLKECEKMLKSVIKIDK
jgi:hypothetical protein